MHLFGDHCRISAPPVKRYLDISAVRFTGAQPLGWILLQQLKGKTQKRSCIKLQTTTSINGLSLFPWSNHKMKKGVECYQCNHNISQCWWPKLYEVFGSEETWITSWEAQWHRVVRRCFYTSARSESLHLVLLSECPFTDRKQMAGMDTE